jgi:hypothetical protein
MGKLFWTLVHSTKFHAPTRKTKIPNWWRRLGNPHILPNPLTYGSIRPKCEQKEGGRRAAAPCLGGGGRGWGCAGSHTPAVGAAGPLTARSEEGDDFLLFLFFRYYYFYLGWLDPVYLSKLHMVYLPSANKWGLLSVSLSIQSTICLNCKIHALVVDFGSQNVKWYHFVNLSMW